MKFFYFVLFVIFFFLFKSINFRKFYFNFYLDITKLQSYLDSKFRSIFFANFLVVSNYYFVYFPYFFYFAFFSPFYLNSNRFFFLSFRKNKLVLHLESSNNSIYFVFFYYIVVFFGTQRTAYNFFNVYIFLFL